MAAPTGSSRWPTPARSRPPHPGPRCNCCRAATTIARHNGSWCAVSSRRTADVGSRNRSRPMKKTTLVSVLPVIGCALLLAGCGLAEVGAAAATEGATAAEQAKQAKKTEQQVEQRIEDAQQKEREVRDAAEAASE